MEIKLLEVTPADRTAAVRVCERQGWMGRACEIEAGRLDDDPIVQDFAQHRIAHQPGDDMVVVPREPSHEMVTAAVTAAKAGWSPRNIVYDANAAHSA